MQVDHSGEILLVSDYLYNTLSLEVHYINSFILAWSQICMERCIPPAYTDPSQLLPALGKFRRKRTVFSCFVWLNNERKTNLEGKLVVLLFEEKYTAYNTAHEHIMSR